MAINIFYRIYIMKVIYANANNMDMINNLLNKNTVVVFFTAPWCGHCQRMKPVMDNVFGRFKNTNSNGTLISVSENEMPRLTVDKSIRGFPTIRQYNNGKKINDYSGMRDEKSLSNYLAKIFNENLRLRTIRKFRNTQKKRRRKRRRKKRKDSKKRIYKKKSRNSVRKKLKKRGKKRGKKKSTKKN